MDIYRVNLVLEEAGIATGKSQAWGPMECSAASLMTMSSPMVEETTNAHKLYSDLHTQATTGSCMGMDMCTCKGNIKIKTSK